MTIYEQNKENTLAGAIVMVPVKRNACTNLLGDDSC